jgi:hypothetical protein
VLALALATGAVTACADPVASTPSTGGASGPPCDGATRVELGKPRRGGAMALFTTSGGAIHLTVDDLNSDGILESSTSTAVDIGPAGTLPTYDAHRGTVRPVTVDATVREGEFTEIRLDGGRYWLWSSNGGTVRAATCPPTKLSAVTPGGDPEPFGECAPQPGKECSPASTALKADT